MPDPNGRRIAILATDMVEQVDLPSMEKMLEVFAKAPVGAPG